MSAVSLPISPVLPTQNIAQLIRKETAALRDFKAARIYPVLAYRPLHLSYPILAMSVRTSRRAKKTIIQGGQNSFRSLAMSTGPEKYFFTSSAQLE
jgi:hypothetical protein